MTRVSNGIAQLSVVTARMCCNSYIKCMTSLPGDKMTALGITFWAIKGYLIKALHARRVK